MPNKTREVPRKGLYQLNGYSAQERYSWVAVLECNHAVLLPHYSDSRATAHRCGKCAALQPAVSEPPPPTSWARKERTKRVRTALHPAGIRATALHMVMDLGYSYNYVATTLSIPVETLNKWADKYRHAPDRPKDAQSWLKEAERVVERIQANRSPERMAALRPKARKHKGNGVPAQDPALAAILGELKALRSRVEAVEDVATRPESQATPEEENHQVHVKLHQEFATNNPEIAAEAYSGEPHGG